MSFYCVISQYCVNPKKTKIINGHQSCVSFYNNVYLSLFFLLFCALLKEGKNALKASKTFLLRYISRKVSKWYIQRVGVHIPEHNNIVVVPIPETPLIYLSSNTLDIGN